MNQVTLLLMRHAKSSWGAPELSDHERPLNKRGRWAAPLMGRELKALGLVPDFVCVSTAVRAQETTKAVIDTCGYEGDVLSTRRLYLAEPPAYFDVFSEVPLGVRRLLVVAHNPGIAELAEQLGGQQVEMCTSGIAQIECQAAEISQVGPSTVARLLAFHRPPRQD